MNTEHPYTAYYSIILRERHSTSSANIIPNLIIMLHLSPTPCTSFNYSLSDSASCIIEDLPSWPVAQQVR